jgi:phosphatidylglycerol:prolipoprotein diacylglycerol transferase
MHFFPSRTVAIMIGPLAIHWYGLMYLFGFIIGAMLLPKLYKYREISLTKEQLDSLVFFIALGVIGGGRLGEVLLWDPSYYIHHPLQIFAVWNGGMSAHGGIVGVLLMGLWYCRRHSIDFWRLGDLTMVPIAIGLALGRIGNFINQEIVGTITTLPWAMHFDGYEGLRHPVQLYAVAKDLCIAALCFFYLTRSMKSRPGRVIGIFFVSYGVLRFCIEYLRDQAGYAPYVLGPIVLTQGQMLTIPVFLAGCVVLYLRRENRAH